MVERRSLGTKICAAFLLAAVGMVPTVTTAQVLEEVIVTAQKREQNLQDVSTAVTAIGTERLFDAGITDVMGLQNYVPSINIGTTFGYANLFMRGLGLNTVFANVDPSVTLYVDGAMIHQPGAQLFSFFDLDRVEVLRGPQGTLYGRNATGGTINLITAKPTEETQGYIRVTGGNYGLFQAEGAVGGSLSDRVLGRVAFQSISRSEGYSVNQTTGNFVDDANKRSFRGHLLFNATDNLDILLSGEYGTELDGANSFYYKRETFPGTQDPDKIGLGRGGYPTGDRGYASTVDPVNDRETVSTTLTVDWQLNDQWALKNILNYRQTDITIVQDLDVSAVVTNIIQEFVFDSRTITEELQVSYTGDRLRATGGFFYFTEDFENLNLLDAEKVGGSFNGGTEKRVQLVGNAETDSIAVYANAIFDISEHLSIKAGLRYTEDDRKIVNDNVIWIKDALGPGMDLRLSPADGNLPLFADAKSFSDTTGDLGIEWRPNDTTLLYYTYSEGFKAGTGQVGANAANIIKPETIQNHELGLKTTFNDRLILNLAAYSYEVTDIQLDRTLPGGPTGFITVFENATNQDGSGVELEAFWAATDNFLLSTNVTYQSTEYGSFLTADPTDEGNIGGGAIFVDIAGNVARQSPRWASNVHGEFDFPLQSNAKLTLSADVSYKDDVFFTEFNNDILFQPSYTMVDARFRYTSANEQWTAEVWGRNLTDELVEGGSFAVATGRVIIATYLPPRTYGVTVGYNF